MEITLYFVGYNADEAMQSLPFDSVESAVSYCNDNPGSHVYGAVATVDFSTLARVYN